MISSAHAAKRMSQIAGYCLRLVGEQEEEAEMEAKELTDFGLTDVQVKDVTIATNESSVYWRPHRWIEFYSQHL